MELMSEDVNWENALTRERVVGKAKVRALWMEQWRFSDVKLEPLKIYEEDGKTIVLSRHIVSDLNGQMLNDQEIEEVYVMREGLVMRADFRRPKDTV
jgi:hypothetical protein